MKVIIYNNLKRWLESFKLWKEISNWATMEVGMIYFTASANSNISK